MSRKLKNNDVLTLPGRARRGFIQRAALLTGGSFAVAMLSASEPSSSAATDQQGRCAEFKAPLRDVEGKVAFITGGSSGIGLGIARAFADAGMKIVLGYRTQEHLASAMTHLEHAAARVHAIRVDVADREGMERAAAESVRVFGKVHVLINNAGVSLYKPVSDTSYEDWDWLMGVNLTGVFNGVRAFLPHLRAHGEGAQIITTASILGLFAIPNMAVYSATKFAVIGMAESMRAELADANVGVSVCCPGVVETNISNAERNRPSHPAAARTAPAPEGKTFAAKEAASQPNLGLDSLELGRLVLQGMRNNDLYILTHSGYNPIIDRRHEAIRSSMPRQTLLVDELAPMTQKKLPTSIYSAVANRERCAP